MGISISFSFNQIKPLLQLLRDIDALSLKVKEKEEDRMIEKRMKVNDLLISIVEKIRTEMHKDKTLETKKDDSEIIYDASLVKIINALGMISSLFLQSQILLSTTHYNEKMKEVDTLFDAVNTSYKDGIKEFQMLLDEFNNGVISVIFENLLRSMSKFINEMNTLQRKSENNIRVDFNDIVKKEHEDFCKEFQELFELNNLEHSFQKYIEDYFDMAVLTRDIIDKFIGDSLLEVLKEMKIKSINKTKNEIAVHITIKEKMNRLMEFKLNFEGTKINSMNPFTIQGYFGVQNQITKSQQKREIIGYYQRDIVAFISDIKKPVLNNMLIVFQLIDDIASISHSIKNYAIQKIVNEIESKFNEGIKRKEQIMWGAFKVLAKEGWERLKENSETIKNIIKIIGIAVAIV
jgi:hypothetical protein